MTQITPERMALYRVSAQQREQAQRQQVDKRFDRAWQVAREAAVLLKTEFGAERVVQRVALLQDKAEQSGDDGYWDGVGLNLHSFYTGVERIFEDIARTLEQTVPDGPNWHQDLLLQMSAEMAAIRPPVITSATRYCLDEFRGFQHVVRNVYAFHLRPSRLAELAQELPACFQAITQDLQQFIQFLKQVT